MAIHSPDLAPAPSPEAATVPPDARVLHIGPAKTGTSSLQGALWTARRELRAQGVRYPGVARHSSIAGRAAAGMHGFYDDDGSVPPSWWWSGIVREVRRAPEPRAIYSSEYLAHAEAPAVRRIVDDMDPARVHVLVTLRPIGRMLSSLWQQRVQSGSTRGFEQWLTATLGRSGPLPDERIWGHQRHDLLVDRWARVVGVDRVTVMVVDGTDHTRILRGVEALLGLRPATLELQDDFLNRSLTLPETRALRALSGRLKEAGLGRAELLHVVHNGAARYLKLRQPAPGEARIHLPPWATGRAAELAATIVSGLRASGVRVVGDLDTLLEVPAAGPDPGPAAAEITADIAAAMAMGVAHAAGMTRRSPDVAAHPLLADTGELAYLPLRELAAAPIRRARRLGPLWIRTRLGIGA